MLTGAICNGSCECLNDNGGDNGCTKIISFNKETDYFLAYNQLPLECKDDAKCLCADRFYQRFTTNVCRRESIHNEAHSNNFIDYSIELNSIGAESNCTSVGTQTNSRDVNIQTGSLESLETPSELNDKFSAFSNRRVRNYINYSKLENSDYTKAESSLESSVKDESTQFGESGESENKSYSGHKYSCYNSKKTYCHCHDPFCPKSGLNNVVEDEIYFGNDNFNPKTHHCMCKSNDSFYNPIEIHRNYIRRQQLGLNSICSPSQIQCPLHTFCPCYNFTNYNNKFVDHCKETEKQITEKFNESYKVNSNDSSQRHTCECKLSFNAQQHDTATSTKMQHENNNLESDKNRAFETSTTADAYKVEIEMLNEKMKRNQLNDSFVIEKEKESDDNDSNFLEENEQSKPLLSDDKKNAEKNGGKINISNESMNVDDERESEQIGEAAEANVGHGCHCHHHHHDISPESTNQNCIRVRPSKKSSKSTSPLKIITLLLFASAFLITGSAIRDAYYP